MSPKDDYVWSFLTDLRYQRESLKRLRQKARENPEMVKAYIQTLPDDWEMRLDEGTVDLLKQLMRDADLGE